jgi:hypothetical protein
VGSRRKKFLQGGIVSGRQGVETLNHFAVNVPNNLFRPDPGNLRLRLKIMVSTVQFCPSPPASSSCIGRIVALRECRRNADLGPRFWLLASVAVAQKPTSGELWARKWPPRRGRDESKARGRRIGRTQHPLGGHRPRKGSDGGRHCGCTRRATVRSAESRSARRCARQGARRVRREHAPQAATGASAARGCKSKLWGAVWETVFHD